MATADTKTRFHPKHEAARIIGVSGSTITRLAEEGVFTRYYPRGKGKGKPTFYDATEIELYEPGDLTALRDYQREKRKAKRARKR